MQAPLKTPFNALQSLAGHHADTGRHNVLTFAVFNTTQRFLRSLSDILDGPGDLISPPALTPPHHVTTSFLRM